MHMSTYNRGPLRSDVKDISMVLWSLGFCLSVVGVWGRFSFLVWNGRFSLGSIRFLPGFCAHRKCYTLSVVPFGFHFESQLIFSKPQTK